MAAMPARNSVRSAVWARHGRRHGGPSERI